MSSPIGFIQYSAIYQNIAEGMLLRTFCGQLLCIQSISLVPGLPGLQQIQIDWPPAQYSSLEESFEIELVLVQYIGEVQGAIVESHHALNTNVDESDREEDSPEEILKDVGRGAHKLEKKHLYRLIDLSQTAIIVALQPFLGLHVISSPEQFHIIYLIAQGESGVVVQLDLIAILKAD